MGHSIPNPPQGKVINRHWLAKKAGRGGASAASVGVNAAQTVTGFSTLSMLGAAAAGTAVSATGVGLVIAGGVLTVGSSVRAARSAYKTGKHIESLTEIYTNRGLYDCAPAEGAIVNNFQHTVIAEDVLPYIIEKKLAKYGRKVASAVPGVGLLEGIRAVSKKGYKYARGSLGVNRERSAAWLANHLLSHNCHLAESIVADLYSEDEMLWLKYHCDGEVATSFLAEKMKST